MQFHDPYVVKNGDSLARIGRRKCFSNPGPIVSYWPNKNFFSKRSPNALRQGDAFLIPWHPDLLRKFIATMEDLVKKVTETANELIEGEMKNREELEEFLAWIDSINLIAQINVAMGSLAVENASAMAGKDGAMETAEVLSWLADTAVHTGAGDIAPLMVPQPEAPKNDYKFYLRHSLGPWTPSYWVTVYGAIKTGDVGIYLYGSDYVRFKNAEQIAARAKEEIIKIQAPLNHAKQQLVLPFYSNRI